VNHITFFQGLSTGFLTDTPDSGVARFLVESSTTFIFIFFIYKIKKLRDRRSSFIYLFLF